MPPKKSTLLPVKDAEAVAARLQSITQKNAEVLASLKDFTRETNQNLNRIQDLAADGMKRTHSAVDGLIGVIQTVGAELSKLELRVQAVEARKGDRPRPPHPGKGN